MEYELDGQKYILNLNRTAKFIYKAEGRWFESNQHYLLNEKNMPNND